MALKFGDRNKIKILIHLLNEMHYSYLCTPGNWSPLFLGIPSTRSPLLLGTLLVPGHFSYWVHPLLPQYQVTTLIGCPPPRYPVTLLIGYPGSRSRLLLGTRSYPVPGIAHDLLPVMTRLFIGTHT